MARSLEPGLCGELPLLIRAEFPRTNDLRIKGDAGRFAVISQKE